MTLLQTITDKIRKVKPTLIQQYGLSSIGIFGSIAREDFTEQSDLDFLKEFPGLWDGIHRARVADALELPTGRRVDLVSRKGLSARSFDFIKDEVIYV